MGYNDLAFPRQCSAFHNMGLSREANPLNSLPDAFHDRHLGLEAEALTGAGHVEEVTGLPDP